jgi:hypothetical protein
LPALDPNPSEPIAEDVPAELDEADDEEPAPELPRLAVLPDRVVAARIAEDMLPPLEAAPALPVEDVAEPPSEVFPPLRDATC